MAIFIYMLTKLFIIIHLTVWSTENTYVSRFGNDSTSCGTQSLPCRSISYAIHQVSEGSYIYLDGSNTSKDPYICQPLDPGHPGIYLTKSISIVGIRSRAYITCLNGNQWMVDGTKHKDALLVTFIGLAFKNTSIHFYDALVNVSDSLFVDSKYVSLKFTIFNLTRFGLLLNDVVFKRNTLCISVKSSISIMVFILIKNSSFIQNGNHDFSTSALSSILWLDGKRSNVEIKLRNCSFKNNTFKQYGMMYVQNSQGMTKLLLHRIKFEENGHITALSGLPNGILFLTSAHVIMTLDFCFVHGTFGTFLSFVGLSAQVNISNTAVERFYSPDLGGGVFNIYGSVSAFLSIKDSYFRNGKSVSYGGVVSIYAPNLMLTIQNSTVHNISNSDHEGSFYVASYNPLDSPIHSKDYQLRLNIINSSFLDCVSRSGGAVWILAENLILTISESWFLRNRAKETGGAVRFVSYGSTTISFQNVYFLENSGGVVLGRATGNGSMFNFNCSNVSFINNKLHSKELPDNGILFLAIERKTSSINLTSTRLISNTAVNGSVVFLLLMNSSTASHFLTLDSSIFKENFADTSLYVYGQATLILKHSIFDSNGNSVSKLPAAFGVAMSNSSITISNTSFVKGSSGAILIRLHQSSCLKIEDSMFFGNRFVKGTGGAVYIQRLDDDKGGNQKHNRCGILYHNVLIRNVWFQENIAPIGGVLTIVDAKVKIGNCVFVNNFAHLTGGQIATFGSTGITVLSTVFKQTIKSVMVSETEFIVSSFLRVYSIRELLLLNTSIDLDTISVEPLILATGSAGIVIDNSSVTTCPLGFALKYSVYGYRESIFVTFLDVSCEACDYNFYSLQRGNAIGPYIDKSFQCMPCPRGADCQTVIKSKNNFWGYNASSNSPALVFTLCPFGYCKSPKPNSSKYNDCQGKRTGVMCGSCSDGYTEAFWSTFCTPIKDCNDNWFWVLFLVLVLFMACLLVFKPPFLTYALKHVLWFRRFTTNAANPQEFRYNNVNRSLCLDEEDRQENASLSSREQLKHDKRQFSRFLEIIFYFFQIAQLLLSSNHLREFFDSKILPSVLGFFNFEPRVHNRSFLCPFPGLTPKTKLAFKILPVFGTMLAIFTIYFFQVFWNKLRRFRPPSTSPYLQASIKTIFLGYTTLATVGISLVRCVSVAGEDRWFYNGNVICYQWWQYLSFAFNGIFVIPLIFVLAWASFKVHHGTITAKQFLLAIVFPLPFFLLWLFRIVCASEAVNVEESEMFCAIKEMLLSPYKEPGNGSKYGAICWQSVLIARRFILVLIFCTITEPSIRLFCMTLACVFVLFFHLKVKPFRNDSANNLESLSLLLLIVLGLINLLKSVFVGFEGIIKGPLVTVFKVFQWLEIVILGLFPALLSLLVCFAIISLILRVLFMGCRSLFKCIFRRCAQRSLSQDTGRLINICEDIYVD